MKLIRKVLQGIHDEIRCLAMEVTLLEHRLRKRFK